MSLRPAILVAALVPFLALPVTAQQMASRLSFTVFGGAAIPVGSSSDGLETGYTVGGVADYRTPSTPFGGRLEGSYSSFNGKGLSGTGVSAKGTDLGANLNLVVWFPMTAPSTISPYITAGPTFSRLEASAKSGNVSFSETQNHWGFNAGGGIDFALGTMAVRFDARYKRISTDDDSFQSIPLTVGIRF